MFMPAVIVAPGFVLILTSCLSEEGDSSSSTAPSWLV